MNNKIIQSEGRVILIKNELIDERYWLDLLNSLTFQEGLALMNAVQEYMARYFKK